LREPKDQKMASKDDVKRQCTDNRSLCLGPVATRPGLCELVSNRLYPAVPAASNGLLFVAMLASDDGIP